MPTETRVIASKPKIGARPAPAAAVAEAEDGPATKSRKGLVIGLVLALVLAGGGAGYWFVLGPGAAAGEGSEDPAGADGAAEPGPVGPPDGKPGKVLSAPAVSINLAGGHYLRLGLGLQLSEAAYKPDPAAAVDAAITLFSGRSITEVNDAESRDALKTELRERLWELYDGDVLDVYYTDYVTQ